MDEQRTFGAAVLAPGMGVADGGLPEGEVRQIAWGQIGAGRVKCE